MSIPNIMAAFSAKNEGEKILIEINTCLNEGRLPDDRAIKILKSAIAAMVAESDPQMRQNAFLRALGMQNPVGPPTADEKEGHNMARTFWFYRLQGDHKNQAYERAAGEHDCSPSTIKRKVNLHPKAASTSFYYWRLLFNPNDEKRCKAEAEIRAFLKKRSITS